MRASHYITIFFAMDFALSVLANPAGMTVASGSATARAGGSQLTITTGNSAVLNWQSFNIAVNETTIFNQPSVNSIVVNNIHDANASQIYGSLQANGLVVLMNQNGFYFGPNSFVKTGGLIVSTANCIPPQNAGGSWEFNGPPPLASIVNYGQLNVGNGGSAFLIADKIENYGDIEAPGGTIGLAAGQTVMLSDRPDGRGLSMQVILPQGSVDNAGKLVADAGTIEMQAKVVNQDGLIQANSVRDQNGVIELVASDQLNLGANSQIVSRGDDSTPGSSGGTVTLKSENNFSDDVGSKISVSGGAQGGDGGSVEISAPNVLSLNSQMDASAQAGSTAGKLFLDPNNINLNTTGTGSASGGTVLAGSNPSTLNLNVNSAFAGFSQIILEATSTITLADNTSWNLSQSTGKTTGQLILEAGQNIVFGNNASLVDANNWSVSLYAGVTGFSTTTPTVKSGVGSINLNLFVPNSFSQVNSFIQLASGSANLVAGQNITVGVGYINTLNGGSIYAHALAGNIDTGNFAQGYHFNQNAGSLATAYDLSGGLGGISTGAGGNVTLIAGGNVTSVLPSKGAYFYDGNSVKPKNGNDYTTAGAGAYGRTAAGNVTVIAGGNVTGNYVVADGTGNIFAGVQMDANENPIQNGQGNYALGANGSAGTSALNPNLALNLINGGWNVTAAQNIVLQEVRNPNGVFDTQGGPALNHLFDYASGDYVNLSAGNLVQLGASLQSLPRIAGVTIPFIYPSILNVSAGAGGVILTGDSTLNQLILFPSPQGSLTINTTGGGSLMDALPNLLGAPQIFNLIVSDSSRSQFLSSTTFGLNDIAATPIHLNNPTPIELNISGDMDLVQLFAPEAAQINVVGNMNNSRFEGMNLAANDVTSIDVGQTAKANMEQSGLLNPATDGNLTVGGDINNRSLFTSIDLSQVPGSQAPDLTVLSHAVFNSISETALASSFFYNGTTLTYENIAGVTLASVLQVLQNLTVQVYVNGIPQWIVSPAENPQNPVPLTTTVSVLNSATAQALLNQFNALGPIPNGATTSGFVIGGGGQFEISARNIDLGTSSGIVSKGVGVPYGSLVSLFGNGGVFNRGADILINASDDLTMYSSSIASLDGGNISINADGAISTGSSVFSVNSSSVRGIYTTSGGDITIIGGGNINVNGSRIITYDGGNITVESLDGNINAGTGASTPVSVTGYYEDPVTHIVYSTSPQIPFSGIGTLTFPSRDAFYPAPDAVLGNILVEAPNGDVNANVSGIIQIPLNNLNYPNAITTVLAGNMLRDSAGNPLTAAALDNSGVPIVQGSLKAAAANDLPQTVIVGNQRLPVSDATWAALVALLGVSPNVHQDIQIDVSSDPADFVAALQGNDANFAKYDYVTLTSPGKNINANGSGIIASNAKLDASGNINGLIFARNNVDISAQQNVNVTVLGVGNVNVNSSGGTISGTIVGVGGVNVSGSSIDASLISANISGATSGQSGLGQGTAANATSQAASSDEADKALASSDQSDETDKKKKKEIALAQKTGRVTVILPAKSSPPSSSQKQTSTQPL